MAHCDWLYCNLEDLDFSRRNRRAQSPENSRVQKAIDSETCYINEFNNTRECPEHGRNNVCESHMSRDTGICTMKIEFPSSPRQQSIPDTFEIVTLGQVDKCTSLLDIHGSAGNLHDLQYSHSLTPPSYGEAESFVEMLSRHL